MKRIWIALVLIVAIVCIVQAQIPSTPPHYSLSIPTPGVEGLKQQVEALRLEINALNEATRTLIVTGQQSPINEDMAYLEATGHTYAFTKEAWTNGDPLVANRGYTEIAGLLINAQAALDSWEVIKAGLESFTE